MENKISMFVYISFRLIWDNNRRFYKVEIRNQDECWNKELLLRIFTYDIFQNTGPNMILHRILTC